MTLATAVKRLACLIDSDRKLPA